jgi:hypothetical protein
MHWSAIVCFDRSVGTRVSSPGGRRRSPLHQHYKEVASPKAVFLVPYADVQALTTMSGRNPAITLTSNPVSGKSRAARLFARDQVMMSELKKRFALLATNKSWGQVVLAQIEMARPLLSLLLERDDNRLNESSDQFLEPAQLRVDKR